MLHGACRGPARDHQRIELASGDHVDTLPPVTDPVDKARTLAEELLWPHAAEIDAAPLVPRRYLDALADAGLYGLDGPTGAGGLAADPAAAGRVVAALGGASFVTAFVWVQHHTAVRLAPPTLLPALCRGEMRAGIAVAALRRPGPPAMRATPDGGGWRLHGFAPQVTGWGLIDVVVVAARHGADLVWCLVDAAEADTLRVEPLALAAEGASGTVHLTAAGHPVGADRVLRVEPYAAWRARDVPRRNGYFALGVAERAARMLESPGLGAAVAAGFDALDRCPDAEVPRVRSEGSLLAVRAAAALVAARGGRAVSADDPAQRLMRDAMFTLVFGQTADIRAAQLAGLATPWRRPRSSPTTG